MEIPISIGLQKQTSGSRRLTKKASEVASWYCLGCDAISFTFYVDNIFYRRDGKVELKLLHPSWDLKGVVVIIATKPDLTIVAILTT